jgi:hypothetical protein
MSVEELLALRGQPPDIVIDALTAVLSAVRP